MGVKRREIFEVCIEWDDDNLETVVWRNKNDALENPIGPTIVRYHPNGNIIEKRWMKDHHTSRPEVEGPAVIFFDPVTGNPVREMFFLGGELGRFSNDPAVINKDPVSGEVTSVEYHDLNNPTPPISPPELHN